MAELTRQCPFDGCRRRIHSTMFACARHWHTLTAAQKAEIWACYSDWQMRKITGDELRERQHAVLDQAQGKTV